MRYKGIKIMAVFAAETADSTSTPLDVAVKLNHSLLQALRSANYITFRLNGELGDFENPYMILNISTEAAAYYCARFQQTSFVYHTLDDDGTLHSEYWEKRNANAPYAKKGNPYVKKYESKECLEQADTDDCYIITSADYKYAMPFSLLKETDETINRNLDKLVESLERKGAVTSAKHLLDFSIYRVGQPPYLYRRAMNKGLV